MSLIKMALCACIMIGAALAPQKTSDKTIEVGPVISGYLSAYDKTPTDATIAYRQKMGEIPHDLSGYDGVIAVRNCQHIGKRAKVTTDHGVLNMLVFDCAGKSDGGDKWMDDNNIVGEIGYYARMKYPEIVHQWADMAISDLP